jgi:hypothetical protein
MFGFKTKSGRLLPSTKKYHMDNNGVIHNMVKLRCPAELSSRQFRILRKAARRVVKAGIIGDAINDKHAFYNAVMPMLAYNALAYKLVNARRCVQRLTRLMVA